MLGMVAGPLRGETLDRVVASIGHVAITEHDVLEEYHFEQFLQGRAPEGSPGPSLRKVILSRLISQRLLAEQIGGTRAESERAKKRAEKTLNEVRKEFSSATAYRAALQTLGMTEPQVLNRLELYQRTLRMIDARLRPNAQPDSQEVETYYQKTFVPEYAQGHSTPPPPLDKVETEIQEILVQKKMNQLLTQWLDRLKSSRRVKIHSE